MTTRGISVVIPTYNSYKTLKLCLKSLLKQTLPPFEVIVINNASSDKTREMVTRDFPKVKLINLLKNTGVTGGRNAGINHSSSQTQYVLFLDHDMVCKPSMLLQLVTVAEKGKNIGIVTPKIYYWTDRTRIWSAGTGMNLWTGQVLFRGGRDHGQYEDAVEVQVAPATLLVKKDVLKEIKKFDDTYFAVYEDTDFCFRAREAGFITYYAPKAIAYHMLSTEKSDEISRLMSRSYWVARNRVLFMKRFGKNFIVFLVFLPVYMVYYVFNAIKAKKYVAILMYMKGTISGLIS